MKYWAYLFIAALLFTAGCASVQKKNFHLEKYKNGKELEGYFDKWELESAKKLVEDIIKTDGEEAELREFLDKIEKREKDKERFLGIIADIKGEVTRKNIEILKKYIDKSFLNVLKFNEIAKYDISNAEVSFGEPVLFKENAVILIAVNYNDDIYYFELLFELKDKDWYIIDFNEKG